MCVDVKQFKKDVRIALKSNRNDCFVCFQGSIGGVQALANMPCIKVSWYEHAVKFRFGTITYFVPYAEIIKYDIFDIAGGKQAMFIRLKGKHLLCIRERR